MNNINTLIQSLPSPPSPIDLIKNLFGNLPNNPGIYFIYDESKK